MQQQRFAMIGDPRPDPAALSTMRKSELTAGGARWAAYQNHDLSSNQIGHLRFLAVGENCTINEDIPPPKMPDGAGEINWRYVWVGWVDLRMGRIIPKEARMGRPPKIKKRARDKDWKPE